MYDISHFERDIHWLMICYPETKILNQDGYYW